MQRKSRLNAFTLVEILVVLGIVVVLAAILFPVFSRVREQGRATTCRGNLKQLATAVQLYAQDNNGHFPRLLYQVGLTPYIATSGSASTKSVFNCPTQSSPDNNYQGNEDTAHVTIKSLPGKSEALITKPATTWLHTDMVYSPPDTNSVVVRPASGVPCIFTSTWHSGGANYSFVDGHVKWLLPETACAIYNDNRNP